jgi:hypothetical protein
MTPLRQQPGTAIQAMSPKKRDFWDLRTSAKVAEDEATGAVKAGSATPAQAAAESKRQALLRSPAANNPFDVPIIAPTAALGLRAASAVVDEAPGMVSKAASALSNAASPVMNSLRNAFGAKAAQPVAAGSANAAGRSAAPAASEVAETIIAQPVWSKEAGEFLASRAAPAAPALPAIAQSAAAGASSASLRSASGAGAAPFVPTLGLKQAAYAGGASAVSNYSSPTSTTAPSPSPATSNIPGAPAANPQGITAAQQSNSNMGLSLDQQRSATDVGATESPVAAASAGLRGENGPVRPGQAYNLGGYGETNAPIYATREGSLRAQGPAYSKSDLNRDMLAAQRGQPQDRTGMTSLRANQNANFSNGEVDAVNKYIRANGGANSFTGSGDGSANAAYEHSDQHKSGVARAQNEKAQLAEIEDKKEEDGLKAGLRGSSKRERDAAVAGLAYRAETAKTKQDLGLRAQANSIAQQKMAYEQDNRLRDDKRADRESDRQASESEFRQRDGREKQLQSKLEERNTSMVDGKPSVNADAVRQQRMGIERAAARLGTTVDELSQMDEERLVAASRLLSKVQAEATNWPIPWKPDYLKTIDPLDLVGLKRNKNGDAELKDGQVIPARFIEKMRSELLTPGAPTNEFEILFAKGK